MIGLKLFSKNTLLTIIKSPLKDSNISV